MVLEFQNPQALEKYLRKAIQIEVHYTNEKNAEHLYDRHKNSVRNKLFSVEDSLKIPLY